MRRRLGVYVHVPFCVSRCVYCDFATVAGRGDLVEPYFRALCSEIRLWAAGHGSAEVDTVFLGGGTPSLPAPGEVGAVLDTLRSVFRVREGVEITLEANPESLDGPRLDAWAGAGVNRVSVGVQSFDDERLGLLGRPHDGRLARHAVRTALERGLAVSIDLMFGLPRQDLQGWRWDLETALSLGVGHLSVYGLESDHDTPLRRDLESGRLPRPDPDLVASQLELARGVLADAGMRHYEISNFCRPGLESRHNLKYWTDRPYLGFGVAAATYLDGERRVNARQIGRYLEGLAAGRVVGEIEEPYDPERRLQEALFVGLRRLEGVSLRRLARRYGEERMQRHRPTLRRLRDEGLLRGDEHRVALAARALPVANLVFEAFV